MILISQPQLILYSSSSTFFLALNKPLVLHGVELCVTYDSCNAFEKVKFKFSFSMVGLNFRDQTLLPWRGYWLLSLLQKFSTFLQLLDPKISRTFVIIKEQKYKVFLYHLSSLVLPGTPLLRPYYTAKRTREITERNIHLLSPQKRSQFLHFDIEKVFPRGQP